MKLGTDNLLNIYTYYKIEILKDTKSWPVFCIIILLIKYIEKLRLKGVKDESISLNLWNYKYNKL